MTRVLKAIGLMSGTSMDGIDAAVLDTDGDQIAAFGPVRFQA
jgi:anhydro-N-acetylmuramic acid kinase